VSSQSSRRRLLGEGEVEELERAIEAAYKLIALQGRGLETPELLLARGLSRVSELYVELRERERAASQVDGVARMDHAAEVAGLTASLSNSCDKTRVMIRQHARLAARHERAIELMLVMFERSDDRICDHQEWIQELGRQLGVDDDD
jgi:hypothetical protein